MTSKLLNISLLLVAFGYNLAGSDNYLFKSSILYRYDNSLFSNDFFVQDLVRNKFYERYFYDSIFKFLLNFFSFESVSFLVYLIFLIVLYIAISQFSSIQDLNVRNKELFLLVFFAFSLGTVGSYNFPYNQPAPGQISFCLALAGFSFLKNESYLKSICFYIFSILFHPFYFLIVNFYLIIFFSKKLFFDFDSKFYFTLALLSLFWIFFHSQLIFSNVVTEAISDFTFEEIITFRSPWHFDPFEYDYSEFLGLILSFLIILNSDMKRIFKRNFIILQVVLFFTLLGLAFYPQVFYLFQPFRLGVLNNLIISLVISNNIQGIFGKNHSFFTPFLIFMSDFFVDSEIKFLVSTIFLILIFNNLKVLEGLFITVLMSSYYQFLYGLEIKTYIYFFFPLIASLFVNVKLAPSLRRTQINVNTYYFTLLIILLIEKSILSIDLKQFIFSLFLCLSIFLILTKPKIISNNNIAMLLSFFIISASFVPTLKNIENEYLNLYTSKIRFHFLATHFELSEVNCSKEDLHLYDWVYNCTDIEDSFIIPPDLTFFSATTERSVFVYFKGIGNSLNNIFEWMERIQLLSGLEPETLDNRNLREMYAERDVEELIQIAKTYGYTYIIFTENQRGIKKISNELGILMKDLYFENNIFYVYIVNNN